MKTTEIFEFIAKGKNFYKRLKGVSVAGGRKDINL